MKFSRQVLEFEVNTACSRFRYRSTKFFEMYEILIWPVLEGCRYSIRHFFSDCVHTARLLDFGYVVPTSCGR